VLTLNDDREALDFGINTDLAKIVGREIAHEAMPAEDRMQAFPWRHRVPDEARLPAAMTNAAVEKPNFTKRQVAGRSEQLQCPSMKRDFSRAISTAGRSPSAKPRSDGVSGYLVTTGAFDCGNVR
jgi:hypothetical protein